MTFRSTMTISEDELNLRAEYYLNQVEWEGVTLLIERDGIIAANIQLPGLYSIGGTDAPNRISA